jgi:tripartite-type tricarboxylate transporter receptor subunit TctC
VFAAALLAALLLAAPLAAPAAAQLSTASKARPLTIISGLPEGQGASLARHLADSLPALIRQPVNLEPMPGGGGVLAANRLVQSAADGLHLGLFGVEATITRELAVATPYTAAELRPVLVAWEAPWALIARASAPYGDLAGLARASSGEAPAVFGHGGLDRPSVSTVQVLGLARAMGMDLKPRRVAGLNPGHLAASPQAPPAIDVMAWPLSGLAEWTGRGHELKILAVLSTGYRGPCAPPEKSLAAQGLALPARQWTVLYEPAAVGPGLSRGTVETVAALLARPEAAALMEADCLAATGLGPERASEAIEEERRVQAALMTELGLGPPAP